MNGEDKSQEDCEKGRLKVNVEYCRVCDYEGYCLKLARRLAEATPDVDVTCTRGRQGAFEVFVNGIQVYSKLQTMALPDFDEVVKTVKMASESGLIMPVFRQQAINCVVS